MNTKGNNRGRPIIHWHNYRYDESQGRWVKKKHYIHPVITVVKLDPEQALLVACKEGGAYWNINRTRCQAIQSPGFGHCITPIKGVNSRSVRLDQDEASAMRS